MYCFCSPSQYFGSFDNKLVPRYVNCQIYTSVVSLGSDYLQQQEKYLQARIKATCEGGLGSARLDSRQCTDSPRGNLAISLQSIFCIHLTKSPLVPTPPNISQDDNKESGKCPSIFSIVIGGFLLFSLRTFRSHTFN